MMKRIATIITLILVGAGCDALTDHSDEASDVTFTTTENVYSRQDTVTAILKNQSDQKIDYNLCWSKIEYHKAEGWTNLGPEIYCYAIAYGLNPEQQDTFRLALSDSMLNQPLAQGIYRLRTGVGSEKSPNKTVYSNSFQVKETTQ